MTPKERNTQDPQELSLEIDTDEAYETIVLTLKSENRKIVIGFDLQEAQMLSSMLNDAVTNLLLSRLGLAPLPPGHQHNQH
jgi:hypothetical protein